VKLTIRPLTPDRWPALQDLFGKSGASNGCWCMYWRIGSAYGKRPRAENRAAFRRVVRRGPPPGLLLPKLNALVQLRLHRKSQGRQQPKPRR